MTAAARLPAPAGKSAVVNALLGQRYLAEGILPTTNEINVLKHSDLQPPESSSDEAEQVCVPRGAPSPAGDDSAGSGSIHPPRTSTHPHTTLLLLPPLLRPPQGTTDVDGVFTRYLPAELLREVNVVDTPGTNVILGRQQRLTEEYVPRADLVSAGGRKVNKGALVIAEGWV